MRRSVSTRRKVSTPTPRDCRDVTRTCRHVITWCRLSCTKPESHKKLKHIRLNTYRILAEWRFSHHSTT